MKRIFPFFLISIMHSCQYFEKEIPSKEELLKQEIKKIDWNRVDEFPSIAICDSLTNNDARKQCFFELLTQSLESRLSNDTIIKELPNIDTLKLKVIVMPDYTVKFLSQNSSEDDGKLDSIIKEKTVGIPIIEPAIKRGIKVKSEFIIPVVLKRNH